MLNLDLSSLDLRSRNLWVIVVTVVLLIAAFAGDIYQYLENSSTPTLTWTRMAATEAEKVAAINCSDHGRAYLDGKTVNGVHVCECHNCYSGPTCADYNQSCVADAVVGDALFLRKYWMRHRENIATLVSGWHRMSYYFGKDSFMSDELEKHIRLLHEAVGNAVVEGKYLVFGNGITQLINGVIVSLSPDLNVEPNATIKKVVAYAPYYPVFRKQTEFFNHKGYEWKGDASNYVTTETPQDFIELVTSPNNPDGHLRKSIIQGCSAVYDHATYWPHYTAIEYASDEDIMMFTLSKYTGHAGSRFGWAFVRDENLYKKLTTYIATNSEGVSRETQFRTLKIIKDILQQMEKSRGTLIDFNAFGFHALRSRWVQLTRLLSSTTRFTYQEMPTKYCKYFKSNRGPSPAYAWIKCEWAEDANCADVLKEGRILAQSGLIFEVGSNYARLSLIKTQDDFDQLMERLDVLVHEVHEVRAARSISGYNYTVNQKEWIDRPFI